MLNKLLAGLLVLALMVGLSVLVMINGWGLEPKSWWWIIGGGLFGNAFLRVMADAVVDSKKGKP